MIFLVEGLYGEKKSSNELQSTACSPIPVLMFSKLKSLFSEDLAIDLGTANTLVFMKGQGVIIHEPSVVAVKRDANGKNRVLAVGKDAKMMLGRTPGSISAIRPMKDGVISDFEVTEQMLRYFIQQVQKKRGLFKFRPRVVIAVPSGITQVEKRAVRESARSAGAREVYLIEEPMAAAIGAGLPISEPSGNMILDVGGGTTEVAVISLSGIVYSESSRIGGDRMDESIIQYLKQKYNILIGERTAEEMKIEMASAYPLPETKTMAIKGRDMVSGIPKTLYINDEEIREALKEISQGIVQTVRNALENTPPELSSDIVYHGIVLAGGGSLLKGLDMLLRDETGLPVMYSDDPLSAVAMGTGKVLEELELLSRISLD